MNKINYLQFDESYIDPQKRSSNKLNSRVESLYKPSSNLNLISDEEYKNIIFNKTSNFIIKFVKFETKDRKLLSNASISKINKYSKSILENENIVINFEKPRSIGYISNLKLILKNRRTTNNNILNILSNNINSPVIKNNNENENNNKKNNKRTANSGTSNLNYINYNNNNEVKVISKTSNSDVSNNKTGYNNNELINQSEECLDLSNDNNKLKKVIKNEHLVRPNQKITCLNRPLRIIFQMLGVVLTENENCLYFTKKLKENDFKIKSKTSKFILTRSFSIKEVSVNDDRNNLSPIKNEIPSAFLLNISHTGSNKGARRSQRYVDSAKILKRLQHQDDNEEVKKKEVSKEKEPVKNLKEEFNKESKKSLFDKHTPNKDNKDIINDDNENSFDSQNCHDDDLSSKIRVITMDAFNNERNYKNKTMNEESGYRMVKMVSVKESLSKIKVVTNKLFKENRMNKLIENNQLPMTLRLTFSKTISLFKIIKTKTFKENILIQVIKNMTFKQINDNQYQLISKNKHISKTFSLIKIKKYKGKFNNNFLTKENFMNNFEIDNKDLYLVNKDHINCNICKELIFDPKMCKECGLLYCNLCFKTKKSCINCLNSSSVVNPLLSLKKMIDVVQLKCKSGCIIPLSDAYNHMISCLPLHMDIDCWNCNKKTFDDKLKINQQKIETNIIFNGKERLYDDNHIKLHDLYLNQSKSYHVLLSVVKDKKTLQTESYAIEWKIKAKETYLAMIENLQKMLLVGESIDQLKLRLKNKQIEVNKKENEIQKNFTDLKVLDNNINKESESIKQTILKFEENIKENQNFLELEIKSKNFNGYDMMQIKLQSINMENEVLDIVILNKIDIAVINSKNKDIKIWDLLNGIFKKTLSGHDKEINCLIKINGKQLASGSSDSSIKIWDFEIGVCSKTLNGHGNIVRCLIKINENQLASGSNDNTIKIWNYILGSCLKTISISNGINCLILLRESKIATCNDEISIKIWDFTNGSCLNTLSGEGRLRTSSYTGHSKGINCITKLSENQLASGSKDTSIKIWSLSDGVGLKTLNGHSNSVRCILKLKENQILSGSSDNTIKLWDYVLVSCLKTLSLHNNSVSCIIKLNENQVASASDVLKIWDI